MKIKFWLLSATLLLISAAISCDTSSSDDTVTSGDCLISAVTLGSLNRHLHTTGSQGQDSTYTVKVTGSLYPMSIDQVNRRVYNLDSLPVGTDAKKVVFSVFSGTSTLTIKSLYTGNDTLLRTADSIDFSQPRVVTAWATDGVSHRDYLVDVRVHKEWADSMTWTLAANSVEALRSVSRQRACTKDDRLYVFAQKAGVPALLTTTPDAPADWQTQTLPNGFDITSVRLQGDTFYALIGGKLATSTDASTWTPKGERTFDAIAAVGTKHVTALREGQIYSSTDGETWQADEADTPASLPDEGVCGISIPSPTDKNFEDLLMVGSRNGEPVVWKRNIDLKGNETYGWIFLPTDNKRQGQCPRLSNYSLARYDQATLLCGETAEGDFGGLYLSRDNGLTWLQDELKTPETATATSISMTVTADNFIYLFCGGSGQVWKGRINRLGWAQTKTSFEE